MAQNQFMVSIRPCTSDDVDATCALWREVFPEYEDPAKPHRNPRSNIERKLEWNDGLFWLAIDDEDNIIGSIMAGYDGHRGWIYSAAVSANGRRQGIGRMLVHHAEDALRKLGCPKVNIQVMAFNGSAMNFWKTEGYEQDHVISFGKRL